MKHIDSPHSLLKTLIADDYAVVASMKKYPFPVLARNQLENGISNNLWYEEIVPHKSIFYLIILAPENDEEEFSDFDKALTGKGIAVQFGGNATIGYGYTKIKNIVLEAAHGQNAH